MRLTWRTEWPHWGILVLLAIVLIISPDQPVPIHWNFEGQVDRLADKWLVLVIIVGLYLCSRSCRAWIPGGPTTPSLPVRTEPSAWRS